MSKYKGTAGHWLGKNLFFETCQGNYTKVLYTLKSDDKEWKGKTYIAIRNVYMAIADPTEYTIATEYFGGWEHWKVLCNTILKNHIEDWRDELAVKLQAQGLMKIRELAEEGDRAAAKILLDKGWSKRSAGAPTSQEKKNQLKRQAQVLSLVENDLDRVLGDDY